MKTAQITEQLSNAFSICQLREDGVTYRCERRRRRNVFFFRVCSELPTPESLALIQNEIVAPSYFQADDASRWSHYLVFLAAFDFTRDDVEAKFEIEADKSFARKIVLPIAELDSFLDRSIIETASTSNPNALHNSWMEVLELGGLTSIATDESRASVIREIRSGSSLRAAPKKSDSQTSLEPLAPFIDSFELRKFGDRDIRGQFSFKAVNLIRGSNGAGKTSLLEAIEHFFCGATLRSGGIAEDLVASMGFGDGKPARRYTQHPATYYQAKDLRWYGRTTNRGNKLFEGFSRYNLLNTDAAADLSRDEGLRDLKAALSKVALGPEASHTWNRVLEFIRDIGRELSPLSSQVEALEARMLQAKARLEALSALSPQSASRSSWIESALGAMGWPMPNQTMTLQEDSEYVSFGPLRGFAEALSAPKPSSVDDVLEQLARREALLETANSLEMALAALRVESVSISEERRSRERVATSLGRLVEYQTVEFDLISSGLAELARERAALVETQLSGEHETVIREFLGEPQWRSALCSDVRDSISNDLRRLRKSVASLSEERGSIEQVSRAQDAVASEIRALGRRYVQVASHADNCPLCQTEMSALELLERIESARSSGTNGRIEQLAREISASASRINALELCEYALSQPQWASPSISVESVLNDISSSTSRLAILDAEVARLSSAIERLAERGFSQFEFEVLRANFSADGSRGIDNEQISRASNDHNLALTKLAAEAADRDERESSVLREIASFAASNGAKDLKSGMSSLASQMEALRGFLVRFNQLPVSVQERYRDDLTGLEDQASLVIRELDALSDEVRAQRSGDNERRVLLAEIAHDTGLFGRLVKERENLRSALHSLAIIKNDLSLEQGLSDFLQHNLSAIQSVFQRIHVPNELRLSGLADCKLERLGSKRSADLSQISTGQRAALMLSIFFTLNLSLRSGPRVMLIDDPVAHIDDLNSLAFLDFLADVAETRKRQVFLATADDRLANLFEKKMAFLGAELAVVDLTSRKGAGQFGIH